MPQSLTEVEVDLPEVKGKNSTSASSITIAYYVPRYLAAQSLARHKGLLYSVLK